MLKWLSVVISALVLIFGFLLFYQETQEFWGSLTAAALSAALVWGTCVMLRWLIEVFRK